MVPGSLLLPGRPRPRLLQLLRHRSHGLEPRVHLRQDRALRLRLAGRLRRRRRRRPRRLRRHDVHRLDRRRSDAGLQDGLPDALLAEIHVPVAADRHGHGLRDRAAHILDVLDGVRHRRPRRRLQGPLRRDLPGDGDPRSGGLLRAAEALPGHLLRLLRGCAAHQPPAGRHSGEDLQVHPHPHGHGGPLLHRRVLRHRHVRRHRHPLHLGADQPEERRGLRRRRGLRPDLRRRHMDRALRRPLHLQDQPADLHELPAIDGALRTTPTTTTTPERLVQRSLH